MKNDRYTKIDLIRGLSILIVILTHSLVPFLSDKTVFHIWDYVHFAVPLFVFCSGYIIFKKYKQTLSFSQTTAFIKKRFSRLLLPYYIFLPFYFLVVFLDHKLTLKGIQNGIFLWSDPDINWLILLFLQLTILVPIILFFSRQKWFMYIVLTGAVAISLYLNTHRFPSDYREYMWIGWLIPFLLSYFYERIEKIRVMKYILFIVCIIFFLIQKQYLSSIGHTTVLQFNKYPPSFYYLSYGLAWLFFLDILLELPIFKRKQVVSYFEFFSRYSYTLYFIHYLIIQITFRFFKFPFSWWSLFFYVLGGSIIIQILVTNLMQRIKKR